MPRALWKGSIAFGLVNIPVELHTAVRENRMDFEESGRLLRFYEDGLHGYTYLEDPGTRLAMYRTMVECRRFEVRAQELFFEGLVRGTTHLGVRATGRKTRRDGVPQAPHPMPALDQGLGQRVD